MSLKFTLLSIINVLEETAVLWLVRGSRQRCILIGWGRGRQAHDIGDSMQWLIPTSSSGTCYPCARAELVIEKCKKNKIKKLVTRKWCWGLNSRCIAAMTLWLVLIVFVQMLRGGNESEKKGRKRVPVKVGSDWICSQLSCTGGHLWSKIKNRE